VIVPARGLVRPQWPFAVNKDSLQAEGLLAWWPMHPAGGNTLFDLVGGYHGTLTNSPTWDSDVLLDRIIDFASASNNYIDCGNIAAINNLSQFSLSAWVKHITTSTPQVLMAQTNAFADGWECQFTNTGTGTSLDFYFGDIASQFVTADGVVTIGSFFHLLFVFDGRLSGDANRLKVYINGDQQTLSLFVGPGGISATLPSSAATFTIGAVPSFGAFFQLDGNLTDIRFYNRALSATEAAKLYDPCTRWDLYYPLRQRLYFMPPLLPHTSLASVSVKPARALQRPLWPFAVNRNSMQADGLVFWLPMSPGGGNVVRELAGYDEGFDGTLQGNAVWDSDPGVLGTIIDAPQSGSSDYIQTSFYPTASMTNLTLSCWVRLDAAGFYPMLMSYGTNAPPFAAELRFLNVSRQPEFCNTADNAGATSPTPVVLGDWHHLVGTLTAAGLFSLFVDGVFVVSGSSGFSVTPPNPVGLRLCRRAHDDGGTFELTGAICDARVYQRALSPAEIAELYDPRTRWELYYQLRQRMFSVSQPAPTRTGNAPAILFNF
jgi:Concanavalin A-like lectin/glucanases superfamily